MRSFLFRNPLDILIAKEARSCKGCAHKTSLWGVAYCLRNPQKSGDKLRRCKKYQEVTK